ncbi:MAG: polysaccharide lyase family protein [Umezawaea sp.]
MSRRTALRLFGAAAGGTALAATGLPLSVAAASEPAVELVDNGTTVTLRNGLVSATIVKATAQTTGLYLVRSSHGNESFNLVGGNRGGGYTTFNYSIAGTSYEKTMSGASYRVVSRKPDRVVIAMTVNDSATLPFVVETHVALERGASGLHYYMIFRYPRALPDEFKIGQLRYAFALGDQSFTYFVVDDERGVQQRPTVQQTQQWKTLQDTTYILPDGMLWSKYQNSTDLEGDNHVFLASNGKVGASLIQASKEFFAGGPTKQELTAHDYYSGEILLWHPFTSHYGSPAMVPEKGWEKVYGPFFLHVDEGSSTDPKANVRALWSRAKERAAEEQAKWPYSWVADPLYAVATRSTVSGRLRLKDMRSAAGAWVLLTRPGEDWQYENKDYWYSARTDADGGFTVKGVRPGTYTLTAFVDGIFGEYQRDMPVVVGVGREHDLGGLLWEPVSHGRTVWQIGTPNRSAEEFYVHGGTNGFRRHLNWLEYPYEFPNGVDFKIGVDDAARKWNYFHPAYRTPGTDAQLTWRGTVPDRSLTTWKIRFDSTGYPKGLATLDIALASSVFGSLRVALNGVELAALDSLPGPPGDNASYRLACRGMYRQLSPISFPAAAIRAGENVITLSPAHPPKAPTSDNWMEPMGGVMYDMIRLQVDEM